MEEWFELMTLEASRQELKRVLECNQETSKYGLSLTEEEARELMACRKETLRESRRVEFAAGILPELIKEFCDSGSMWTLWQGFRRYSICIRMNPWTN